MIFGAARTEHSPSISLDEIKEMLCDRLEALADALDYQPTSRRGHDWRSGKRGSSSLIVQSRGGLKRGTYSNFEHLDKAGSPLDFIMVERGLTLAAAIQWAKDWLGITPGAVRPETPAHVLEERARKRAEQEAEAEAHRRQRTDVASRIWAESVDPHGTPAVLYFERRGIILPSPAPDAVRWHSRSGAVVFAATTDDGTLQAVQRVFITLAGHKLNPDELERRRLSAVKMTIGPLDGAVIRLPAVPSQVETKPGPLLLCEGPETGLSVWLATGHETHIALGQIGKAASEPERLLVVCRDDDPIEAPADKAVRRAVQQWRASGTTVAIATPWPTRRHDKSDFNDTLIAGGNEAVAARIAAAMPEPDAPSPPPGLPAAEASAAVSRAMEPFFADIQPVVGDQEQDTATPRVWGIRADVSVGKSHQYRRLAVATLRRLRAAGDNRSAAIAIPTHKLAREQEELFAALIAAFRAESDDTLTVEIWRGRRADDPSRPGKKMCDDLDAVADAEAVGAEVQTAVCRQKKRGQEERTCPHFAVCSYQAQRRRTADIWPVPHELLFNEKPTTFGDLAFVIVDEAAWADGLEGTSVAIDEGREKHPQSLTLSLDALGTSDKRPGDDRNADWMVLTDHRLHVRDMLRKLPDGPLPRDIDWRMDEQHCLDARQLEFTRKINSQIVPGLPRATRRALVEAAQGNRLMLLLARFWKALAVLRAESAPEQSGWLSLATIAGENGPQRVLQMKGRRDPAAGWQVPTLIVDALLDAMLLRPFWPQIEVVADIRSAAPHQRIRQTTDRAFAKSRLEPLTVSDEAMKENPELATLARKRAKALRDVRDIIVREARRHRSGQVLVVAQLAVKLRRGRLSRSSSCCAWSARRPHRYRWRSGPSVRLLARRDGRCQT